MLRNSGESKSCVEALDHELIINMQDRLKSLHEIHNCYRDVETGYSLTLVQETESLHSCPPIAVTR